MALKLEDLIQQNIVQAAERRRAVAASLQPRAREAFESEARLIDIRDVQPNPHQPRTEFKPDELKELTASITQDGQLQPIMVRPMGLSSEATEAMASPRFEIIMGERRWRAALAAGWTHIQAIVREADDGDALRLSLIENIQRVDLNAVDKGAALKRLKRLNPGLVWSEIGALLGLTEQSIHNLVGLLKLPPDIQQEIRAGALTEKHGRALRQLSGPQQRHLAQEIKDKKLTGDAAMARARTIKAGQEPPDHLQAGNAKKTSAQATNPPASRDQSNPDEEQTAPLDATPATDPMAVLTTIEEHVRMAVAAMTKLPPPQGLYERELKPALERIRALLSEIEAMGTQ